MTNALKTKYVEAAEKLTPKQKLYVGGVLQGLNKVQALTAAGYADPENMINDMNNRKLSSSMLIMQGSAETLRVSASLTMNTLHSRSLSSVVAVCCVDSSPGRWQVSRLFYLVQTAVTR